MAPLTREGFEDRVAFEAMSNCWLWLGSINPQGYGRLTWNGRTTGAHRVAYELYRSPIPPGLDIDHLCSTPGCVNPWHLEPVTCGENIRRAYRRDPELHWRQEAARLRIDAGLYRVRRRQGERFCSMCRDWHPTVAFARGRNFCRRHWRPVEATHLAVAS